VNLRPSGSFAVGLDRVPRDMVVKVHQNEQILNSAEAERYKSGQIALELARGAARQTAQNSQNNARGMGGETNEFHGDIHLHGVNDAKKIAREAKAEGIKNSRRSNAKNLQQATSTGF
jgi:hypothetical protein